MIGRSDERALFEQFRVLMEDLPEGEVFHRDKPDFLIRLATETLGIEITRVFKPSPSAAQPEAALDSTADAIVSEAREFAKDYDLPALMVRMYFNLSTPIKKVDREGIARDIAALICDNVPEPGHTVTLEYGMNCDRRHPRIVDLILISRASTNGDDWGRGDAMRVEADTRRIFQSAINEKAKLLGSYLTKCDRCWLLLSAEFMKPAQALSPDSASISYVYTSPFERTYFLNCTQNTVWQLNTTATTTHDT